jgi:methylated-DNA-protein-cysteine methyltransferase related protein
LYRTAAEKQIHRGPKAQLAMKRTKALDATLKRRLSNATPPLVTATSNAIRQIPRGRVSTYGAIAKEAGYPRCARHVARVLKLVGGLPWHRVLGSGGRISLRGELALEQRFLLEAEGVRFRGKKVDMKAFEHRFGRAGIPPTAARKQRIPRK